MASLLPIMTVSMFSFPKLSIRTPQSLTHTIRMRGGGGQQRSTHVWKRGLAPLIELMSMICFYDLRLASATVCSSSSLLRAQQDTSFVHRKLGSSVGDGSTLSASAVERESCPDTLHGAKIRKAPSEASSLSSSKHFRF